MIRYQKKAAELILDAIKPLAWDLPTIQAMIERPQNPEHGDLAFPCFSLAKEWKSAPNKISLTLADKLQNIATDTFESALAVGPYLNFKLSPKSAYAFVEEAIEQGEKFGFCEIGAGKRVLLEYSSPNVAKEFHIGHFRNTILGQSLCNIYRATGHEVIAINHLGDWGSQFGKVAYAFTQWGSEADLKKSPLAYLTSLYVRFHEAAEKNPDLDREARLLFKKIEEGDAEYTTLWQRFVALSIEDLERIYARLGVKFDHYWGESFYFDKVDALLNELRAKKLLVESEGAQIVSLEKFKMPPCLILTGDGTTLYHTRDLAAALYRKKQIQFSSCLYVVGSEQTLHFEQVFKVLELMGYEWVKDLHHIRYGLYRFKDGKFSTRKGKVVLFQEVLEEATSKVEKIIADKNPDLKNKKAVEEIVGLGALVFNDLATDRNKDVEFDWQRVLDFEGDTGPYVQYTFARASSILRKAKALKVKDISLSDTDYICELEKFPDALALMKLLGWFGPSLVGALRLNKPSIVAHFALDLAKCFNSFYRNVKVLDDNSSVEAIQARLRLVTSARIVLRNALAMICMQAPDEM